MGRLFHRRVCLGIGLFLGLDAVPLRQLVVLEQLWLGMVPGGGLRESRMGQKDVTVARTGMPLPSPPRARNSTGYVFPAQG